MSDLKRYLAIEPILRDNKRIEPGQPIDLSAEQAMPLLKSGAVRDPDGKAAAKVLSPELQGAQDRIAELVKIIADRDAEIVALRDVNDKQAKIIAEPQQSTAKPNPKKAAKK